MNSAILPPLVSSEWNWRLRAACRGDHVGRYFNDDKERGPTKRARDASAKAVCGTCPVVGACLDWALTVGEAYGIWGGATPSERVALSKASLLLKAGQIEDPDSAALIPMIRSVA
ncbi:MAG: Transcription factor WhiB [Pseudonocardiales bacterium]|nr:Transcription factor WhiB [Pseudonocardiales bacterium]